MKYYLIIFSILVLILIYFIIQIYLTKNHVDNLKVLSRNEISELGSKIIVVGNSPDIMKEKKGKLIDNFDIVVRFNEFKYVPEYTGKKTTIWVTHYATNKKIDCKYKIFLYNCNKFNYDIKTNTKKILSCFNNLGIYDNKSMVRKIPNEVYYYKNKYVFPTSGFALILYLLNFNKIIYIHGFSFDTSHYYNDYTQYLTNKTMTIHDYNAEKEIIDDLIKKGRIMKL